MMSHTNSQGESITVESGELYGEAVDVLCMYDDPPPYGTGTRALMLLDDLTRAWLQSVLDSKISPIKETA